MEFMLPAKHSRQKSFYGKAIVQTLDSSNGIPDNIKIYLLKSYNTPVCAIKIEEVNGVKTYLLRINGWYSNTTCRHIDEFIQQYFPVTYTHLYIYLLDMFKRCNSSRKLIIKLNETNQDILYKNNSLYLINRGILDYDLFFNLFKWY